MRGLLGADAVPAVPQAITELRLVPVAAAAWAASWAAVRAEPPEGAAAAWFLLGLAAGCLAVGLVLARRSRTPAAGRSAAPARLLVSVAVPLGLAAAVFAAASAGAAARAPEQLRSADGPVSAVTELSIGSEPRPAGKDRFSDEPRWLLEARAERIIVAGEVLEAQVPLLVAGGEELAGLREGQRVRAVGQLRPGSAGAREAFVLELDAPPGPPARAGESPMPRAGGGAAEGAADRAAEVRSRFHARATGQAPFGERAAGLLPGMVLGDRSSLDTALEQQMKDTGLTHLTAVSGSNCGYVLAAGYLLARLARWPRALATAAALALLAAFTVVVGPDPSVLRAAVMGALGALALLAGRGRAVLSLLCLAVTVLLVADPWLGEDYGFILSVTATASLILLGPGLARSLAAHLPYPAAVVLSVPLAAQLGCSPVLVLLQPEVPVYSVAANLLAGPAVPVVTLAGMAGLVLDPLPMLPDLLLGVAAAAAAWVAAVAGVLAAAPGALLPWPGGAPGALLMAAACAGAVTLLLRSRRAAAGGAPQGDAPGRAVRHAPRSRLRSLLQVGAVLLAGILAAALPAPWPTAPAGAVPGNWVAAACDVGQGDAVVLRSGPDAAVLVDTGPEPEPVDRCLERLGIRRLDLLVLTHAHADHYGGLDGVLDGRPVQRILWSSADGSPPGTGAGRAAPPELAGSPTAAGEQGAAGSVRWQVLWPPDGQGGPQENDASLVLLAELDAGSGRRISILLTGDLEEEAARRMLARHQGLADGVDILKVAHHGARNGGTATIDAVDPALALVSVGADNTYGHPAPEILAGLARAGTRVARTDQLGTVVLAPGGGTEPGPALRVLALDSG
ncbi:ComEC family competence protein [Arthrobacter saudimassiliensis]|uniref:ComEC family competence protein n=1 Tax=Arthrobacter saudimassiliensis TaxID=1461584 RepID=A0A078MLN4_9MICC|nr:ComEC family competence protein [Arthrobacter saudimassiliensis]